MNIRALESMSAADLDAYGEMAGFDLGGAETAAAKIARIEELRNRSKTVSILGVDVSIAFKAVNDKRVSDLLERGRSDEETERAMRLLLGEDQFSKVVAAATDEDGTVDVVALGYAFVKTIYSDELKNF